MQNVRNYAVALFAAVAAPFAAMASETTPIEDLFASADIEGVSDLVLAMGTTIIAIALVFVGIKLVKRGLSRT